MRETRFNEEDFPTYLQEIINTGSLDPDPRGITAFAIDKGVGSLSSKQKFVLIKEVIEPNYKDKCRDCEDEIPWSEMTYAVDNGGRCSWCANRASKDS